MSPILIIKLGALGDFVQALAAMRRIRAAHPDAHIDLLTTPPFAELAAACPYVDAVATDGRPKGLRAAARLIRRLRRAGYARVYDLQTSSRSSAYFQLLRPAAPEWSGIAAGCSHPHANPERDHMHTLERQADQLRFAGVWPDAPTAPGSAPPPDLSWLTSAADPAAFGLHAPYALLIPGGSAHRPEKRWPAERFGALAAELAAADLSVAVLGAEAERPLAQAIQAACPAALDLTGRTRIVQLGALTARAALVVGNDTGPTHVAAASGAPTLALFSAASDPALCAPRGNRATALRRDDLSELSVSDVKVAARKLLARH